MSATPPPPPPRTGKASDDSSTDQDAADVDEPAKGSLRLASGDRWWTGVTGAWSGLVKGLAAVGGFAATYELARNLGRGDEPWSAELILSVIAFGVGVILLLAVSVVLATTHREWMSDLVRGERRRRRFRNFWELGDGPDRVDRETLLSHESVEEFQAGMLEVIEDIRSAIEEGREPSPRLLRLHDLYLRQRDAMLEEQGRRRVARSSVLGLGVAVVGVALAVGGYANAWYLSNLDARAAEVTDAAVAHDRELQTATLEAALERPDAMPVVPAVEADVTFTLPDAETAAAILGTGSTAPSCWQARAAIALSWGEDAGPNDGRLLVAIPATEACPAATGWITPGQLGPGAGAADGGSPDEEAGPAQDPTPTPSPAASPTPGPSPDATEG